MAHQRPEIIVYGYEMAPNPQKLFQFLALFKVSFKYVEVPVTIPRPGLAEIGITYRRTPLLSIGSDMYVDNALILEKICDIAQHSDSELDVCANHVEYDALGQQAFRCAAALLPRDTPMLNDEVFLSDRSDLIGRPFDPEILSESRPRTISAMLTLVNLIESHFLRDGKRFFLGGTKPTTADMHLYWSINWGLRRYTGAQPEISLSTHPKIFEWLSDVDSFILGRRIDTKIDMTEAYKVLQLPPSHEYAKFVPHVSENPEKLSQGQRIAVTPVDTGRNHPQYGELISLNYEQVCLRNDKGLVMHFPRTGYSVVAA